MIDTDLFMRKLEEASKTGLSAESIAITAMSLPLVQSMEALQSISKSLDVIAAHLADIKFHGIKQIGSMEPEGQSNDTSNGKEAHGSDI